MPDSEHDNQPDTDPPKFEVSAARRVLMQALDSMGENEEEAAGRGDETVEQFLVVLGATVCERADGSRYTIRHWDSTDHPHFVFTGMMAEVAIRMAGTSSLLAIDGDDEDDEEDDDAGDDGS